MCPMNRKEPIVSVMWRMMRHFALLCLAIFSVDEVYAQTAAVEYGFVRDELDATRIVAVAYPNGDFANTSFVLIQGATFIFDLPAGTVSESEPYDPATDLVFTPANGSEWQAEVFTDTWMESLGLDTGGRDVYRFSLSKSLASQNADNPYPLFSFSLPTGCGGGSVKVLTGAESFATSLLASYQTRLENSFSVIQTSDEDSADIYAGNHFTAAEISCEAPPLAVSLAYFYAQIEAGSVQIDWQTATEMGIAGYNLLAEDGHQLVQLNGELIPAEKIDSLGTQSYHFVADILVERYYLEEVAVDGSTVRHGPFLIEHIYGNSTDGRPDATSPAVYLPLMEFR